MEHLKRLILSLVVLVAAASSASAEDAADNPSRFSWGADIGGAIDLSGHDMSTINIDAFFGYSGHALDLLGVGAGINMPVNNSRREFPVYGIIRTSFSSRPRPVFAEVRAGIAVNTHPDYSSHTNFYLSPGIGFRLASGRAFSSYLIVGYIFNDLRVDRESIIDDPSADLGDDLSHSINGIHSAVVRLGIRF